MSHLLRILPVLLLAAVAALAACETDESSNSNSDTGAPAPTDVVSTDLGSPADVPPADADEDLGTTGDTGEIPTFRVSAATTWETSAELIPFALHQTWQQDPARTVTIQWALDAEELPEQAPRVWFARLDEIEGEDEAATLPYDAAHVTEGRCYQYTSLLTGAESFARCEVELTGLEPNTDYHFRAGFWAGVDGEAEELRDATVSSLLHFRTGHAEGGRDPFTFIVAGDSRGGYDLIDNVATRLAAEDVDFWLFSGDMTDTGSPDEWNTWFEVMEPIHHNTVLMPIQGNHEAYGDYYLEQFALPRDQGLPEGVFDEMAWTARYGNMLVVGLDSRTTGLVIDQVEWLERILPEARADETIDWIVLMFHHTAYSASSHGNTPYVQEHWIPVFEQQGVDLVFTGHDHNYERTVPIRAGAEVAEGEGIVYVVAGGFFAPGYGNGNEWWTAVSHPGDKGNYVVVDVDGATLTATAYSGDGTEVLDEFTLTK